jgi:SSS family solute:Na+ symporter
MSWFDLLLISFYLVALIILSVRKNRVAGNEEQFLLSGRSLTLPAFIATLVSTWYGGILGVGEFTWLYGISQWFAMGLPYYLFALLFAVFLAGKVRNNPAMSIPEAIFNRYGNHSGDVSSILIFLLTNPAPYILMVALLAQIILGTETTLLLTIVVALFSAIYVSYGGFTAVVRTDMLQVILMYGGFFMLFGFAWNIWGDPISMWHSLPDLSKDPTGGQPISWLVVWFFIAMWTFVDPSFHQRAAAAKSPQIAKRGIIVSVCLWFVFDFLTLFTALYGVANLPNLERAALVFPEMAQILLPSGLRGLFFLTLLATIMSSLDSYLFLSGQTLGRDLLKHRFTQYAVVNLTRIGIGISAVVGIIMVWLMPSVIEIWYTIGSILIPGLLIPVLGVYSHHFGIRKRAIIPQLVIPCLVALGWLLIPQLTDIAGAAFLSVEPFYMGLGCAAFLFVLHRDTDPVT